ncbi:FitA-like ribbon-helix-helix domain-containing protein [Roseomonas sp. CECT 9278]|uniref:FitA-like ribbon-helix-helix domain-containing protein n=1 Tax=Roseomonas sp. CECT 9278 TaxID=2845823 RepID=UPI001E5DAF4E|nr:plasmid stabilization protein [Roseomonas sp. CECT 9278]CAH0248106.1 Antitoxin FitA [Roseomonas sp. CECT 9278]
MSAVTIRNLSEETHRALKLRAARHGRSTEAEMRAILDEAVRPKDRVRLGSAMAERSRRIGLTNEDVEALEEARARQPAEPMRFG